MRKTILTATVATALSAGAFLTSGANAMTVTAPAGLRPAIEGANVVEPTRYVCYRNRRGVRACSWRANRRVVVAPSYGYYGAAPYGYGYGGYPYYGGYYGYGPSIGFGLGYGWGGGWGGGSRTVVHRHVHRGRHR
jgi:hypothetical protein